MKIATLDLGTNTFRLLISENLEGKFKRIYRETDITRLGEGVINTGRIKDEAIKRSISILSKYKTVIDEYGVKKIFAAGTSALRNAENGREVISRIYNETGIEVRILSGDDEAEITLKGVIETLDNSINSFYHLDIGGGSTEISLIREAKIIFSRSIDIGVVSLAEDVSVEENSATSITIKIDELLANVISNSIRKDNRKLPIIATSPTPIVIACILEGMKKFVPSVVNSKKVKLKEIEEIVRLLIKHCNSNELDVFGEVLTGREDLIVPGGLILFRIMKFLENDCMIISDSGLIEGLLYS